MPGSLVESLFTSFCEFRVFTKNVAHTGGRVGALTGIVFNERLEAVGCGNCYFFHVEL